MDRLPTIALFLTFSSHRQRIPLLCRTDSSSCCFYSFNNNLNNQDNKTTIMNTPNKSGNGKGKKPSEPNGKYFYDGKRSQ
eukprot:scaffold8363_cov163-Amphora_coffeaeformis.AAC.8